MTVDQFFKALLHDADPKDVLIALEQMTAAVLQALPPNQRRELARELEHRVRQITKRTNRLARERKNEPTYCRHSTRH
jgi:hypothetical protein